MWADLPSNADSSQLPPRRPPCAASIPTHLGASKPASSHHAGASLLGVPGGPSRRWLCCCCWHRRMWPRRMMTGTTPTPMAGAWHCRGRWGRSCAVFPLIYDTTHKQGDRSPPPGAGWRWCCRGSAQGTGACGCSVGVEPAGPARTAANRRLEGQQQSRPVQPRPDATCCIRVP